MAGCLNGGSCLFDKIKDTFFCSCKRPWSGEKCNVPVKTGKAFSLFMRSIFSLVVIYNDKTELVDLIRL